MAALICGSGGSTNSEAVEEINNSIKDVNLISELPTSDQTIIGSINVLGYNTINDGGGGLFNWDSTVNKSTANGGTRIDPSVPLADQGTGVGLGCWVLQHNTIVNIKQFGAKNDFSDNTLNAFNNAIDDLTSIGGGKIFVPSGIYKIFGGEIVLKNGVQLIGDGSASTKIKLGNGANKDLIKTFNFDSLTLQNKWLVSDGVQHSLGISGITLDGNKANNTSGRGWVSYAKRLFIDDVIIMDTSGVGWYSEGGDIAGQTDETDLPESQIKSLWIRNCGNHGMQFRGPHDAVIHFVAVNECDTDGLRVERSAGVYSGSVDLRMAHVYSNRGMGFYSNTSYRAGLLICENNDKDGYRQDGFLAQVETLQLYTNGKVSGDNAVYTANAKYCSISDLQIKDNGINVIGLKMNGDYNSIGTAVLYAGGNSSGTGLQIDNILSGFNIGSMDITGYTLAGGKGFNLNNNLVNANINLNVHDCDVGVDFNNKLLFGCTGKISTTGIVGQTSYLDFSNAVLHDKSDLFVYASDNGIVKTSIATESSTGTIDLTITTLQIIVIPHKLLDTVNPWQIIPTVTNPTGDVTDWSIDKMFISAVDATNATIKVQLGAASATGGAVANLTIVSRM